MASSSLRWLRSSLRYALGRARHSIASQRQQRNRRLFLEPLETRHLLTSGWGVASDSGTVTVPYDPGSDFGDVS